MKEANEKLKVLIVEDSPTQAEHLKHLLETNNHSVVAAGSGKEALSILRTYSPAIIISDIVMPEMDGYQLCKKIKADEKLRDIPVMLLTVLSDPGDVLKGLACNADNFITKPYDEKYLLSRIHYILINRELRKSEKMQLGVEVYFSGQKFLITSERQQILDLLLSTYDIAVRQNSELVKARDELSVLNEKLEQRVEERTSMLSREIDDRKNAEMNLLRSNRALKMLSECNETLVRSKRESDLLDDICTTITEIGGYSMAWVGFKNNDEEKTVRPAAESGFDEGYLDRVEVMWSDTPLGRGPTGTAIRTKKAQVVNNIRTDPAFLPWRDEASHQGYSSVISFPLLASGVDAQAFGALTIYASEPDAFHPEEVKILAELASDLAFGVLTLRMREERKRAEDEVKFRNVILSTQSEVSMDGILVVDENDVIISYNRRFVDIWGIPPELVEAKDDVPVLHFAAAKPVDSEGFVARVRQIYEHKEEKSFEDIALKDGRVIERYSAPMFGADKRYYGRVWYFRDITGRKQAEEALRQSEAELREAQRVANVGSWELNLQNGAVAWSEELYRIFGLDSSLPAPPFSEHSNILTSSSMTQLNSAIDTTLETGESFEVDLELVRGDGTTGWITARGEIKYRDSGAILLRGTALDITERRKIEEALYASQTELYDKLFAEDALNLILSESLKGISFEDLLNKAIRIILAIPWFSDEPMGSIHLVEDDPDILVMKAQDNLPESTRKACARVSFGKCLCGNAALTQKMQFCDHVDECHEICPAGMHDHGHYVVPILSGSTTLGIINVHIREGYVGNRKEEEFLVAVADTLAGIIMRKRAEDRIEYLAYYDAPTGLPNRALFTDRLTQGIARAVHSDKLLTVLTLDIDRFKSINDTYGFEAGDTLLREVADRLQAVVREGDTVARLGNDDFGLFLIDLDHTEDIILTVEKIMRHVSQPVQFGEKEIVTTLSAGISVCPADGKDAETLLKNADLALSKAKQQGRKTYLFYTEDLNIKAGEFVSMERNLVKAFDNAEFRLYYQPYFDITNTKIAGMEALLRWISPEYGIAMPGKFIPVLEESGMIQEVGEWILTTAVAQVKEWQNKGHPVVPVSVNLSSVQFRQRDLADTVKRVIQENGFHPSLLNLEITESAFMQDIAFTKDVLANLKDIGIAISIDDFGTGYSSLSYLKKFPVDNLKIDISFVRELATDPDAASIITAIIAMARTLGIRTIAEGVETEEQWKILRLLRCNMGQGYYLGRPMPTEEAEKFLM